MIGEVTNLINDLQEQCTLSLTVLSYFLYAILIIFLCYLFLSFAFYLCSYIFIVSHYKLYP